MALASQRSGSDAAAPGGGLSSLERLVRAAVEAADRTGTARFVSASAPLGEADPLALFEAAAGGPRTYWCRTTGDVALATRGAAAVVEAAGEARFEAVRRGIAEIWSRHAASPGADPRFVGGFAFDAEPSANAAWRAFPPARFVLPAQSVWREGRRAIAVATARIEPGAEAGAACARLRSDLDEASSSARRRFARPPAVDPDPPRRREALAEGAEYAVRADRAHDVYRGQVAAALRAIERGELEKVVLARSLLVRHPGRFDVESFLASLVRIYPSCTVLAFGSGDDTLIAATPERLVRRDGAVIETSAVAGSAPRGRSPAEDDALGRALQTSAKERAEHRAVVAAIRAALDPVCGPLAGPEQPELLRVDGIQHLSTPLLGRVPDGAPAPSVLGLVERLHPTPAVGGLPAQAARDWLAERESLARGWYAGPVGWLDAAGSGEFVVALRSGIVRNAPAVEGAPVSYARLFAGAGIVAGSDPESELRETRLKLRALLAPLTEI